MRSSTLFLSLSLALALVACGDKDDAGETGHTDDAGHHDGDDGDGDATAGEAVFSTSCAGCHGASGEGVSGPAMADVVPSQSASGIVDVTMNGIGGMPAILTDATEAENVAAYCVATWGS